MSPRHSINLALRNSIRITGTLCNFYRATGEKFWQDEMMRKMTNFWNFVYEFPMIRINTIWLLDFPRVTSMLIKKE